MYTVVKRGGRKTKKKKCYNRLCGVHIEKTKMVLIGKKKVENLTKLIIRTNIYLKPCKGRFLFYFLNLKHLKPT